MSRGIATTIAQEYRQPTEPSTARELIDYLVMEIECVPERSYSEAINEVFAVLRPRPEEGEQALAWFAGACIEGMQPARANGGTYGWDEFQAAVVRGAAGAVRRAIATAEVHFHNNGLRSGRSLRLEIVRAARIAEAHCPSCEERFEGRERIARAVLAAHMCGEGKESSDGTTRG